MNDDIIRLLIVNQLQVLLNGMHYWNYMVKGLYYTVYLKGLYWIDPLTLSRNLAFKVQASREKLSYEFRTTLY